MKNLSKVLAVVLAFAMALSMVSFAAYTDVKAGDNCEEAVTVLSALEILKGYEDGSFKPEATITRAEFATVVIRLLGLADTASGSATQFNDVAADHWASGAIALAAQQGIVNGYGDGNFGPEDPVKYNEAIKMLVAALGYTPMADANGGWPGGFQVVASQKGILSGISGVAATDEAPRGVVAQLAYNSLTVPLMEQTGFGTQTNFATVGSLLLNKLGVTKFEGVVDATSLSSNLKEGKVKVDYNYQVTAIEGQATAKKYDPASANGVYCNPVLPNAGVSSVYTIIAEGEVEEAAKELIDVASVMYVKNADSDNAELVCILKDGSKNEIIEFMSEDVKDYNATENTLEVYTDVDAGDYEEYVLDINKIYINGRVTSADKATVLAQYLNDAESADIKLLSQEEDEFNVAYITDYVDVKVTRVTERTWKVSYQNLGVAGTSTLVLDETDKNQKFEIYKDGEIASFADIKEDDVLSIAGGIEDGKLAYGKVYIISDRVEGKVTAKSASANKLAVDGTSYKAGPSALNAVAVGDTAVFFKNYRGILVAADTTAVAANVKYGFATYARNYDSDYSEPATIRLLTAEGKWEVLALADTVSIDGGARIKSKDIDWDDNYELVSNSNTKYGINKVVAYDLNADGKIQKLYIAANTADIFFAEDVEAGNKTYDADTMTFGDEFMDEDTVIFSIDSTAITGNYDTEDDDVQVVSVDSLVNGAIHHIEKVYDYDESGIVGCVLGVNIAAGIDYAADFFVVTDDAMQSTNEAGEEGVLLTGVQGGDEVTLFINTEGDDWSADKATFADADAMTKAPIADIDDTTFGKGDVLLYTLNAKGEAAKMLLLLDASDVATGSGSAYGYLSAVDGTTGSNTTVATVLVGTTTYKFVFGYANGVLDNGNLTLKATGNTPSGDKVYNYIPDVVGNVYDAFTGTGRVIIDAGSADITPDSDASDTDFDGDMVFARVIGSRIQEFVAITNEK